DVRSGPISTLLSRRGRAGSAATAANGGNGPNDPGKSVGWAKRSVPTLNLQVLLLIDLRLDKPCQVSERLLPTQIASLGGNDLRYACLYDVQLGADRYFLQRHSHLHLA